MLKSTITSPLAAPQVAVAAVDLPVLLWCAVLRIAVHLMVVQVQIVPVTLWAVLLLASQTESVLVAVAAPATWVLLLWLCRCAAGYLLRLLAPSG